MDKEQESTYLNLYKTLSDDMVYRHCFKLIYGDKGYKTENVKERTEVAEVYQSCVYLHNVFLNEAMIGLDGGAGEE